MIFSARPSHRQRFRNRRAIVVETMRTLSFFFSFFLVLLLLFHVYVSFLNFDFLGRLLSDRLFIIRTGGRRPVSADWDVYLRKWSLSMPKGAKIVSGQMCHMALLSIESWACAVFVLILFIDRILRNVTDYMISNWNNIFPYRVKTTGKSNSDPPIVFKGLAPVWGCDTWCEWFPGGWCCCVCRSWSPARRVEERVLFSALSHV